MYRCLQNNVGKAADATLKAGSVMKRGMLVEKGEAGEVDFPTVATDKNVYFVGKEFVTTGVNGDRDLPDYSPEFENIEDGEFVVCEKPVAGEKYFTDQITGTFTKGGYALVGTDGRLVSTTSATKLKVVDTAYNDCGSHPGIAISILD